jgi:replicative DNA helicase
MAKQLYSQEYEKCLLGSMINDNDIIDNVESSAREEYFYFGNHRTIYNKIIELYSSNKCCDIVMLSGALPSLTAFIASLTDAVSSSSNYKFYVKEIKNLYKERKYLNDITGINENKENKTIDEVLSEADNAIMTLVSDVSTVEEDTARSLCSWYVEYIDNNIKNRLNESFLGYDSGFEGINSLLDGIPNDVLWVIGARPSMGKTSMAEQLFYNLCSISVPSAFISLEMKSTVIMSRIVSANTGIRLSLMRHGMITKQQLIQMQVFITRMFTLPMVMVDTSKRQIGRDIDSICSKIRSLAKRGTKVFFIDHLGFISCSTKMKRNEQVGEITKRLADLKNQLGITIILLCQLTRDSEGKEPSLNSLRESGDIEQDADIVSFIHREREMEGSESVPAKFITEKNRDGRCGIVNLLFYPYITKFTDERKNVQETSYGNEHK